MSSKMDIVGRFFTPPRSGSFFLFGPRGTGKSTWIRSTFRMARFSPRREELLAATREIDRLILKDVDLSR